MPPARGKVKIRRRPLGVESGYEPTLVSPLCDGGNAKRRIRTDSDEYAEELECPPVNSFCNSRTDSLRTNERRLSTLLVGSGAGGRGVGVGDLGVGGV